jgi:hypothetical protein
MSVDRVEIHNNTATRIPESPAVPAQAQEILNGSPGMPQNGQPAPQGDQDRPEWLPPKFQSAEELARAYSELESKFTQVNQKTFGDQVSKANISQDEMSAFSSEFMQHGTLSDKSFANLEARGIPRYVVESYIEGQKAVAESQVATIYSQVGGPEQYQAMVEWASDNLPENEIDAFNEMIESGNQASIQFAVRGLQARYATTNNTPRLMQGGTTGPGTSPFRSLAEVTAAMRDPKYKNDPAYRRDVEDRLKLSNVF